VVRFPILERIQVKDYELYPGDPPGSGLNLSLTKGPWLVIGVNGLGKSTLLLIIRHMLSGPFGW
jgi:ABC-type cobalamin/Fe3+-siderophores transport system ATPase subunit